jgi:spermidine synthase
MMEPDGEKPAAPSPDAPDRGAGLLAGRPAARLVLISAAMLLLELACIRWFGATVAFLTFFTNIILLASVTGIGVGCLAARHRWDFAPWVLPLLLASVAFSGMTWDAAQSKALAVSLGDQERPDQVYYGAEDQPWAGTKLPIEALAAIVFALVALTFVGLGQAMGRAFREIPNRLVAYAADLGGSIVGTVGFAALSAWQAPPVAWFAIAGLGVAAVTPRRVNLPRGITWRLPTRILALACLALLLAGVSSWSRNPGAETYWSPYYRVEYFPDSRLIRTNAIGHQMMHDVRTSAQTYSLPYLLARDAGMGPFRDVLVMGAGSGNDVAAALANGAESVRAVEIDPVLQRLGHEHHPNRPYDDPRVTRVLDDGRSFVRSAARPSRPGDDGNFDLIVYALVDSLVLHSGYSSLRLESFLYTEDAFRDAKARLRPGGIVCISNYFRQGWMVARLREMAKSAFGGEPIVISIPFQADILPDSQRGYFTMLLAGNVEPIRAAFAEHGAFWSTSSLERQQSASGFAAAPPQALGGPGGTMKIAPSTVKAESGGLVPTDDWPFLYLRTPSIPWLNLRGMLIMAGLAVGLLAVLSPARGVRPSGRMFFLGAGFMLLETKGIVHLALLFGSTWMVNSIVFAAVLIMVLLSNLLAMAIRPAKLWPWYAGLFASLAVNLLVPMETFLGMPGPWKAVLSCAVVFTPIAFAGVIFAAAFARSEDPDADFGANVGGIVLGGLSEYASLLVGFNGLIGLAIAYYALSALGRRGGSGGQGGVAGGRGPGAP